MVLVKTIDISFGKDYFDEEQILTGLTETANDTVDLYAIWADSVYEP